MSLLKYLLFALVIGGLLKYLPSLNLADDKILGIVLISTVIIFVIDNLRISQLEGMTPINGNNCDDCMIVPNEHTFVDVDEDYSKTGLTYDNNEPGNPLVHEGQFDDVTTSCDLKQAVRQQRNSALGSIDYYNHDCKNENGISKSCIPKITKASRLEALYNQHNHNIKWSPHTHFGKSRGYLNWDPNY